MKSTVAVVAVALLLHQVMANTDLVTKASNTFSNKLYEKVAKEPGNVLVCPISLHIALGLVLQGAGSNTSSQLVSVLGFSAANAANTKDGYKELITAIKDNTLKVATKMYPAIGYDLNSSYVSLAQDYFLSGVEGVDYSKPVEAANKINKYVEEHTNNKIHDLISADSISDLTKLIIINAVHFQATWQKTFTTAYDDYFKVSPGEKVLTKMMSMTDFFHYKEDPALDAKVLKMDYTDGGYSMLFVLPNKEDGLKALETKLVTTDLSYILEGLKDTKVEVTIPKFKLEKTINLKEILISMGLTDMFSSRADLHGIANGDKLYVSDVIQKTFINVHENGTEAAAATGIYVELLSASFDTVTFSARWPFYFTLVHTKTPRMRLFSGRLVHPSKESTPSQEPVWVSPTQQEGLGVSEKPSVNNENIINSGQGTKQSFRPDGGDSWVTDSESANTHHSPPNNGPHTENNLVQTQSDSVGIDQRLFESPEPTDNQEDLRQKTPEQSQNHNTNRQGTPHSYCLLLLCNISTPQSQEGNSGIEHQEAHSSSNNQNLPRQKSPQQPQNYGVNKKGTNSILPSQLGSTEVDQHHFEDQNHYENRENMRRTPSQQPPNYNTNKENTRIFSQTPQTDIHLYNPQSKIDYSLTQKIRPQQSIPSPNVGLAQGSSLLLQWPPNIVYYQSPYQQRRYQQSYIIRPYV